MIDDPSRCTYDPKELVGTEVGERHVHRGRRGRGPEDLGRSPRRGWEVPVVRPGPRHGLFRARRDERFAADAEGPSPSRSNGSSTSCSRTRNGTGRRSRRAGFELLWEQSVEEFGAVIGTDDPDLTRFRDRGGKIIITHGLADQLITGRRDHRLLQRVLQRMGGRAEGRRVHQAVHGARRGTLRRRRGPGARGAVRRRRRNGSSRARRRTGSRRCGGIRPARSSVHVRCASIRSSRRYKGRGSTDDAASFECRAGSKVLKFESSKVRKFKSSKVQEFLRVRLTKGETYGETSAGLLRRATGSVRRSFGAAATGPGRPRPRRTGGTRRRFAARESRSHRDAAAARAEGDRGHRHRRARDRQPAEGDDEGRRRDLDRHARSGAARRVYLRLQRGRREHAPIHAIPG